MKTLDAKLAQIHADPANATAFILADAKDADMAFGLSATGIDPTTGQPRSLADFRDQIREVVRQGLIDIMLMSPSTSERLAIDERLFDGSTFTLAVRATTPAISARSPAGATSRHRRSRFGPRRSPS